MVIDENKPFSNIFRSYVSKQMSLEHFSTALSLQTNQLTNQPILEVNNIITWE